mgnify:CR=1 FL=1
MRFIAHKHVKQFIGLLTIDIIVFSLTDALAVPSFMLIVGFLLLAATIYYLTYGLLTFFKLYGLSIKRKQRVAASITALIAGLIALQSIGQLNSRDVFVMLPLVALAYLYSYYARGPRQATQA